MLKQGTNDIKQGTKTPKQGTDRGQNKVDKNRTKNATALIIPYIIYFYKVIYIYIVFVPFVPCDFQHKSYTRENSHNDIVIYMRLYKIFSIY